MHSVIAPVVKVDLGDGKIRDLQFDYEALARIEEIINEPVFGKGFIGILSYAKNAAPIIWAGLFAGDQALTLEEVKKLLRGKDPTPFMTAIMDAWGLSMPKPEASDEKSDPTSPETSSDGSISGQSPSTT